MGSLPVFKNWSYDTLLKGEFEKKNWLLYLTKPQQGINDLTHPTSTPWTHVIHGLFC